MPKTAGGKIGAARAGTRRPSWLLGPALVAGVAYLDPGNVASNMTAGARFGYLLVWVVVAANLAAWLVQYLSAKLGVVTGRSLPQLLGARMRNPWGRRAYWLQAEIVAMATDIAEVIGGAVALNLLFALPLVWGGMITGVVSTLLLVYQSRRGARAFEIVVIGMLLVIAVGFCAGVFLAPPEPAAALAGLLPHFEGTDSVLLAASILGATIMPHAIYAHSALARDRFHPGMDARRSGAAASTVGREAAHGRPSISSVVTDAARAGGPAVHRLLRATRWDVTIAMAIAGTVNLAMLLLAAAALAGIPGTDTLEGAYTALRQGLGPVIATLFALGLLASGLASTAVGAYAGSEIMAGLLRPGLPLLIRRVVTLVPAIVLLAIGADPTGALVLSQVVLSFGIPFALVPLVWLTARREVLGAFRNRRATTIVAALVAAGLVALNIALIGLVVAGG
ncbi:MAG: Nramp family divalent metal transporter [Microbacterium sp.]